MLVLEGAVKEVVWKARGMVSYCRKLHVILRRNTYISAADIPCLVKNLNDLPESRIYINLLFADDKSLVEIPPLLSVFMFFFLLTSPF